MADYPHKSPAARYIDRDGVPVPVDLDGNEIPDESAPAPEPAGDDPAGETKLKRGSK